MENMSKEMELFDALRDNEPVNKIKMLVESGIDINAYIDTEDEYMRPLQVAARYSSPDVVQFLLTVGADINGNKDGSYEKCAIHEAVLEREQNDVVEILRVLVESGAKLDARDEEGETALYYALDWEKTPKNIVDFLVQATTDAIRAGKLGDDYSPVYDVLLAIANVDIAKSFLNAGASASWADEEGYSLIHYAASALNGEHGVEFIKTLIAFGANVDTRLPETGETPLHIMISQYMPDSEIIRVLLDEGTDVNACSRQGTPLFIEENKRNNDSRIIQMLKDSGGVSKSPEECGF